MPRTGNGKRSRPTFIEEARRTQIIEAARGIFLKNGFEKSTLSEIAEAISVSKGVILYHFGNKSEIGKAVLEEILAQYGEHISSMLGKKNSALEKLLEFPVVCARYIETHQDDFILHLDTLGAFGNVRDKRSYMASANELQRGYLVRLITKAKQEAGATAINTQDLADVIQAFVDGINSQYCVDPEKVNPTRAAKLFRSFLKKQLKG